MIMKRFFLVMMAVLCISAVCAVPVQASPENTDKVKEFNLVFLHGYNGHSCDLQLLEDSIAARIPRISRTTSMRTRA